MLHRMGVCVCVGRVGFVLFLFHVGLLLRGLLFVSPHGIAMSKGLYLTVVFVFFISNQIKSNLFAISTVHNITIH